MVDKTPAEKISLDINALSKLIERRLDRVSGAPGKIGFVLAISTPNTANDLDPESPRRVVYVSNCKREDGVSILGSLFANWVARGDDNAYFVEKMLKDMGV